MTTDASPAPASQTFRFADIDQFRSAVRHLDFEFTPLVSKISAEQIILNLPGCDVNFMRSFPRIVDGRLAPNCTAVGFSMDDGFPMRFNGAERDYAAIAIGSHGAVYNVVERVERQFASIVFTPVIQNRGWPQVGPNWRVYETSVAAQNRLRTLVRQILSRSSAFDALEASAVPPAIKESLLASIDAAFADAIEAGWTSRANSIEHFKIFRKIQTFVSDNIGQPVYSDDLALQVGVSVRTLHDAVQRYRGMSLHRYLRIRRLWLVRQRLLAGTESVKSCALAFGFWHMGEFAKSYRLQFGESPSETGTRSRSAALPQMDSLVRGVKENGADPY